MQTSNTFVINTAAGFNTEIVLDSQYDIDDVVALLSVDGEMRLMTAFPKADPSDWLLPTTVMEAGIELAINSDGRVKMWAAGTLTEVDGQLYVGRQCVGSVIEGLTDLPTMIRNLMH